MKELRTTDLNGSILKLAVPDDAVMISAWSYLLDCERGAGWNKLFTKMSQEQYYKTSSEYNDSPELNAGNYFPATNAGLCRALNYVNLWRQTEVGDHLVVITSGEPGDQFVNGDPVDSQIDIQENSEKPWQFLFFKF